MNFLLQKYFAYDILYAIYLKYKGGLGNMYKTTFAELKTRAKDVLKSNYWYSFEYVYWFHLSHHSELRLPQ